ncbi:MAG: HAD-IIB family hydrolase [Desulfobacteraceae bacterium]|nr:MAG: HAD-IIB family hydrolase [Desulfobacteraceae bacterium]
MKPFHKFPLYLKKQIRYILTDIDDTLTSKGRLPAVVFTAMERLKKAGIIIIPITGRPAGWCDHIARMWPVNGLVGENGAFYFSYDDNQKKMLRRYWKSGNERREDRKKLDKIKRNILKKVPGCSVASDQAYREADLAIDYCEDVPPLSVKEVDKIVDCFTAAGAQAKISSIHVNGWFGDYDKLSMTKLMFTELFNADLDQVREQAIFTGDSPNDAPMFEYFPHSVGVANVRLFTDRMPCLPVWVTKKSGGEGFAEMAGILLRSHFKTSDQVLEQGASR